MLRIGLNRTNLVGVLAGVGAAVSVALSIGADAYVRYASPTTEMKGKSYARLDRELSIDGRGVFLRFGGYDAGRVGYAAKVYYRAVYDLYPRIVLLADPSVVISNADDITNSEAPPDPGWLTGHGIDRVLTVHYQPNIFEFSAQLTRIN